MNPIDRRTRRLLAPLLGGLLLATSVLVPILDRTAAIPDAALETEHHAATCVQGHDHTICTQVGANLWAPGDGEAVPEHDHASWEIALPILGAFPTRALTDANPSRAPPSA